MSFLVIDRYGDDVIVAPCLVTFLREVQFCVAAGVLNVYNAGEIGNRDHLAKGWTASDHNPYVQWNGKGVVRAADFGGPDYSRLLTFWNMKYGAKDPRVWPFGYTNSNLNTHMQGLTKWFGDGSTNPGTDGPHAHLSVTQRDGYNKGADGWVGALASTAPWGLYEWLTGKPADAPVEDDDMKPYLIQGSPKSNAPGAFYVAGLGFRTYIAPQNGDWRKPTVDTAYVLSMQGGKHPLNGKPPLNGSELNYWIVDNLDAFGPVLGEDRK